MSNASSTTTVTVTFDHPPTIEEVQDALDILRAEGIPDSFDVTIDSRSEREYIKDVPLEDRPERYTFTVSAERAAKSATEATR